jgi:hypothetical protein
MLEHNGLSEGHVVPEARLGGPIALVKNGDRIIIDAETRSIDWLVDEKEKARRKTEWDTSDKGELTVKRGVLFRYARDVAVSVLICIASTSPFQTDSLRTLEPIVTRRHLRVLDM